ncbi:MAG: phosphate uptake regulator PhoU [Candidatus Aenigmarchaeota archaeon]|nr:phosphate uptake regulator PhoU [Candidatus Aenigmarchaeota archaeon]
MERKIQKISNSYLVSLPIEWIKTFKLGKGDKIYYDVLSSGTLLLSGQKHAKKHPQKGILYNEESFERDFFRLYLYGYDFITIRIKNQNQARKIHNYLEQFINVEIIEEDQHHIEVNNYDIDTITPKKCFRRIFFLTGNMYDKLKEIFSASDARQKERLKSELKETDKRLSAFYFILIRDVRKHFSNWNFLKEEESLTRYMDLRMAAEKLERIGDLIIFLSELKKPFADKQATLIDEIFAFNKAAVFAFLKNDCAEADKLYKKADEWINDFEVRDDIFQYNVVEIIKYIKDILNLTGGNVQKTCNLLSL